MKKILQYDDLFDYVGQSGMYQGLVFAMGALFSYWGVDSITMNFAAYNQEHWCRIPELEIFPHEHQKYVGIPANGEGVYDSCLRYDLNYSKYTVEELWRWNRTLVVANDTATKNCDAWVFDQTLFVSTINSRFNLVCDRGFLSQLVNTIYFGGVLVGSAVSGILSDKYGRKWTIFGGAVLRIATSFIGVFAPNYAALVIGRFFYGLSWVTVSLTCYVLMLEVMGPKYRAAFGIGTGLCFSLGYLSIVGVAYAVRDDKWLQFIHAVPNVIFIGYIWVFPESPRWLIAKGRYKEAEKELRKIAAVNKKELPKDLDLARLHQGNEKAQKSCGDLMRSPRMRTRTCIVDFYWFVCSLMYYALSLNSGTLSGDLFVNNILLGIVEIPANLLCLACLSWSKMGRRLTCSISHILGGVVSFIAIPLTLNNLGTASTAMSVIGKAFITIGFAGIYVYSIELFPTEVRNAGIGTASMFARVSGMAAPYIGAPLQRVWGPMPSLIFGVVATTSGLLTLALPETLGQPILDTVEEAEIFAYGKTTQFVNHGMTETSDDEMNMNHVEAKDQEAIRPKADKTDTFSPL